MGTLDDAKLLHIWTEVSLGRGRHGNFLKSFADSYIHADPMNLELVRSAGKALVVKYSLDEYLDNFQSTNRFPPDRESDPNRRRKGGLADGAA
jgi:hypothetical protein